MVFSKLLSEGYQSVTITGMLNSRNHQLETTNVTKILQNLELLFLYVCVWVWGGGSGHTKLVINTLRYSMCLCG